MDKADEMDKTDVYIRIANAMSLIEKGLPYRAYSTLATLLGDLHGMEWVDGEV